MIDTKIQWHPGFIAAMNLELKEYRANLIFEKEYNLNTKPLEIDLLIIKKEADIRISNEIGEFFRGHNILEYKSPGSHLSIDTFFKTLAYSCLYKSYSDTTDSISADDITMSIIRESKPEGLFQYFKENSCQITNPYKGIYHIKGPFPFPSQIIATGELDKKTHTWLSALSGKLNEEDIQNLLEHTNQITGKTQREMADSVLEVSNGGVYQTGAYYLEKYIQFATETNPKITAPDRKSVEAFLEKYEDAPGSLYNAAAFLREFSRYLIARGYLDAYLIPTGKTRLPAPAPPYFFTEEEISAFFRECDNVRDDPHYKGRHLVLPAMFRLLYCCGLRCKEVRILARKDVHLDKGYFDVLQSKGPKSRRIYISRDLIEYLDDYDRHISCLFPERRMFFPNRADKPYGAAMLEKNFLRFWYSAFPEKKDSGVSIRAYDFRHHFVYANMNRWLRSGKDVNAMLPYLMRYMGHTDVKNTLYYFHLVPDICNSCCGSTYQPWP